MSSNAEFSLVGRLAQSSPTLSVRMQRLAEIIEPLLSRIYSIFPAYTDHSRSHSEQVLAVLGWLLPSSMPKPLSTVELFYLICAAYLHDIGMLDVVANASDIKAQAQIRDSHHLRSEKYVKDNYAYLGLTKVEADAIGEICRSHRRISIERDVDDQPDGSGGRIRMRLLCAAIRLADELHLTADRAPQLVLDAIQPPTESLVHFQRHLSIVAVGPVNTMSEVIEIHATVQTSAGEQALRKMESEIQGKLDEILPILGEHGLQWRVVELKLQRRSVVERKLLLHLTRAGACAQDRIAAEIGESLADVKTCLEDLRQLHYVDWVTGSDTYQLVADKRTFEYSLRLFLKTDEELSYTTSEYCRHCIDAFVFDTLCTRFDAVYDPQERADRVLVLYSSPTALYLLFYVSGFQAEEAIVPRRSVLDAALILGILTDIFRFPQIAQIREIVPAAMAIHHSSLKSSEQQLRLFKALGPDRGRDMNDVFQDLVPFPAPGETDQKPRETVTVTVTHPKGSVERGLTFPHLLRAAQLSGTDLMLAGKYVQMSVRHAGASSSDAQAVDYLIVSPDKPVPSPGCFFCNPDLDRVLRRITLRIDPERSDDRVRYPVTVETTPAPGQVTNISFRFSVYLPSIDVVQTLLYDEMLQWLRTRDFHRLALALDRSDPSTGEPVTTLAEALSANLHGAFEEPFLDSEMRDILGILASLQQRLGTPIATPLNLTAEQRQGIKALAAIAAHRTNSEILEDLGSLAAQTKPALTSIRVSVYFANRQLASDRFFGPVRRFIPRISLNDEVRDRELSEYLRHGEGYVRISRYYAMNASSLAQQILNAYASDQPGTLVPNEPTHDLDIQTSCMVTIHPIEDKLWYREQVIRYEIYDVSERSTIMKEALEALDKNEAGTAGAILQQGLLSLPDDPMLTALLGWAQYKAGDIERAYTNSRRGVDLQGEDWPNPVAFAYYNLGLVALLRGAFEEGFGWYQKAVSIDRGQALVESIADLEAPDMPTEPEFLFARACLYEQQGNTTKALELYRAVVLLGTPNSTVKQSAQEAVQRLEGEILPDPFPEKPAEHPIDPET